jgi:hypothetical protein
MTARYDLVMRWITVVVMLFVARTASADVAAPPGSSPPGTIGVDVVVGKTVEIDVGYARGLRCDDTSIVRADVITRNDHNYFVVTGVQAGRTQCRVGTSLSTPPWFVFDVHVAARA